MDEQAAAERMSELVRPGASFESAGDDIPAWAVNAVVPLCLQLQELAEQRSQAIQKWREALPLARETEERDSAAMVGTQVAEDLAAALDRVQEEGSWIFAEAADANWMKQRSSLVNAAKQLLVAGEPAEVVRYVLEGFAASRYRRWGEQQRERVLALETELKKRFGKVPALGGDGRPAPPAKPNSDKGKPIKVDDWLAKQFSGQA